MFVERFRKHRQSQNSGSGSSSPTNSSIFSGNVSTTHTPLETLRSAASSDEHLLQTPDSDDHDLRKDHRNAIMSQLNCMSSIRLMVLVVLSLQNSLFTLLRRYSQGIKLETYSKYECLLVGEVIKMVFSAWMIRSELRVVTKQDKRDESTRTRLLYLVQTSRKMVGLALIYGAMNILSFVSLRNIGAGLFTIFAQMKIITTATFSAVILQRTYSWTKWRALTCLMLGVILFSHTIWDHSASLVSSSPDANPMLGTVAVLIEVSLSGFASIYFEKVIKLDPLQLSIWERNFQLSLGSIPVYLAFIAADGGGKAGFGGGWSILAFVVASLGAAGGLLVALSIKYGDSILKTLATTSAIVLSSILDNLFLGGPLTPIMALAGCQVILSICDYTFDQTIEPDSIVMAAAAKNKTDKLLDDDVLTRSMDDDEQIALMEQAKREA